MVGRIGEKGMVASGNWETGKSGVHKLGSLLMVVFCFVFFPHEEVLSLE